MLQKFTNDCSLLQQSLQTIQNQLSPISDTYGDKEILEDKLKKLMVSFHQHTLMLYNSKFAIFSPIGHQKQLPRVDFCITRDRTNDKSSTHSSWPKW